MRIAFALFPATLVAAALVVACSADRKAPTEPDDDGGDPTATFTRVQNEVFTTSCAFSGCHAGSAPQQGMDLSAGNAYAAIVGVPAHESPKLRIESGDPGDSYLIDKIRGNPGISGARMPLGGPYLTAEQIALVENWVRNGAKND